MGKDHKCREVFFWLIELETTQRRSELGKLDLHIRDKL